MPYKDLEKRRAYRRAYRTANRARVAAVDNASRTRRLQDAENRAHVNALSRIRQRRVYASNTAFREHVLQKSKRNYSTRCHESYCSCVYIVYSPSNPTWIKVGATAFPEIRLTRLKGVKSNGSIVERDAVFYYKHEVHPDKRLKVERLFINELKKQYTPISKAARNESFFIDTVDDLEIIRELLVEVGLFEE